MRASELEALAKLGEDSGRQFKEDIRNTDSLAAEMVALSNSAGGSIEGAPQGAPINASLSGPLTELQRAMLQLLARNPPIAYNDLAEQLSKTEAQSCATSAN